MDKTILTQELKKFISDYKGEPYNPCLKKLFNSILPYLNLNRYSDPHKVLEPRDFSALAFEGYWEALLKYDPEKGEPITWIYLIVRQKILKALKDVDRSSKNCFNSSNSVEFDFELYEESIESVDDSYKESVDLDVSKIHQEIFNINPKAGFTLQLKLAFPDISRTSIAIILGLKRRNGIAKFMKTIRIVSLNKMNPEVVDYILNK